MPPENATPARPSFSPPLPARIDPKRLAWRYSAWAVALFAGMVMAGIWSPLAAVPFGLAAFVMHLKAAEQEARS